MSAWQIAEPQISHARPNQFFHFVADIVKHPANLPINSLPQDDAQFHRRDRMNAFQLGAFAVEHDAAQQFRREFRVPGFVERDFVFLVDLESRMRQLLREIAVIRQNEQPFALRIEPANIEEPRKMRRQQIEDCVARIRIASRRNKARRFVQHDVEPAFRSHHFAADLDVISLVRLITKISADATVDRDPAGRD